MEKMDFYVYLSPKEAAEKVKEAVTAGLYSGEILDEYVRILPNGKEIIMVLLGRGCKLQHFGAGRFSGIYL